MNSIFEHPRTQALLAHLHTVRLPLHDEKAAQAELANALEQAGFSYEREKVLSPGNIVDFLCEEGIAIELKIKGRPIAIFKQLERYAETDAVNGIVLFSGKSMHLPAFIKDKPARAIWMSWGWL